MNDLATEQAKAETANPLGLYVHVPFCASTCDFCAFYQTKPTAACVESFLTGVAAEAKLVGWNRPVTTVFWGGGTPGLLAPRALSRLAETINSHCGGAPEEWSVEMAPASVTPQTRAHFVSMACWTGLRMRWFLGWLACLHLKRLLQRWIW